MTTSAPSITVYSKPNCVQCDATYRALDRAGREFGLEYTKVDFTTDPAATKFVMGSGFLSAPVVVTADDSWGGFQADKLTAFIAAARAASAPATAAA